MTVVPVLAIAETCPVNERETVITVFPHDPAECVDRICSGLFFEPVYKLCKLNPSMRLLPAGIWLDRRIRLIAVPLRA